MNPSADVSRHGLPEPMRLVDGLLVAALAAVGTLVGWWTQGLAGPGTHDEFSYLLMAETFAGGRLTNPSPPLWAFFETYYILVDPTYMSRFPPLQGFALALGWLVGLPAAGILLGIVVWSVAATWALNGFFARRWALLGGGFIALYFSVFHYWAQTYYGGALVATGGALVWGAAWRWHKYPRFHYGALLALGAAMLMLGRPFEGLLACLPPGVLLLATWWRRGLADRAVWSRLILPCVLIVGAAGGFQLMLNRAVTGDALMYPYFAWEDRYLRVPVFVWDRDEPRPPLQHEEMERFREDHAMRIARYGTAKPWKIPLIIAWRPLEQCRLTVGAGSLLLILAFLAWGRRQPGYGMAVGGLVISLVLFILGRAYFPHYQSPLVMAYILAALGGLHVTWSRFATRGGWALPLRLMLGFILLLNVASAVSLHESYKMREFKELREGITALLGREAPDADGHLVFVHYEEPPLYHNEWVFNPAALEASPVIWARDMGARNRELAARFSERRVVHLFYGIGTVELWERDASGAWQPVASFSRRPFRPPPEVGP